VIADRERCIAQGAQLSQRPATGKRKVGRPREAAALPAPEPEPTSPGKRRRASAPTAAE
jgi:hypothetical protein